MNITLTEWQLAFLLDLILTWDSAGTESEEAAQEVLERAEKTADVPEGLWKIVENWMEGKYI